MPADRAPSVLIADPRSEVGHAVAIRFMLGGWFVIGCDSGSYPGRQTKAHITADTTRPDDSERAVAAAKRLGNGLDFVVDLDPASLLGDAALPVLAEVDGHVIRQEDVRTGLSPDEAADLVWSMAPHDMDADH